VALGSSIVAGEMFHSERPEKMGYPIAGVAQEGEGGGATAEEPIEFYLAKADPAKGAQVFNKCGACHTAAKGGPNMVGPDLWGVIGEPIAQGKGGFPFSDALKKVGGTWNWDNLSKWLTSPRNFAPGTKMTFAGLSNPQDRADVIAFLNSHSDAPKPLPAAPAGAAAGAAGGAANAGPNAADNQPGNGPNNGPQKAEKEPTPGVAAEGKRPETTGGEGNGQTTGVTAKKP
jgi:cytochrome c